MWQRVGSGARNIHIARPTVVDHQLRTKPPDREPGIMDVHDPCEMRRLDLLNVLTDLYQPTKERRKFEHLPRQTKIEFREQWIEMNDTIELAEGKIPSQTQAVMLTNVQRYRRGVHTIRMKATEVTNPTTTEEVDFI